MSETLSRYKIGFIGLGNMGWPMARHLHRAGAEVTVWNRSEVARSDAGAEGMTVAASPADVASALAEQDGGFLCMNLTHTEVVESIFQQFLPAIGPETVVIDFGTTGHAATLRMAEQLQKKGGQWLDAPVSGGQLGAEEGNLTIMVGGERDAVERASPLLEVIGEKITHMGEVGAGQVTKYANQLIVAQTIDAVAQALRLAELAGVESGRVREALQGGFAESRILDLHGDRMVRRDFVAGGRSELQLKDVRLISQLAEDVGLDSSTLRNSLEQWVKFVEEKGNGDLDHSGLFRMYE